MDALEKTARAYEELLVPALFDRWARRLVDMADLRAGSSILDVACGTGVVARTIHERQGDAVAATGVDINPGMLAVARDLATEVDWQEGNAESLPFEDESFDTVFCQFGLMLFSSPAAALREMHRVLKRGGMLQLSVFDSLENNRPYKLMADLYGEVVEPSVGDTLRFPFSMGDTREVAKLFEKSGIPDIRISTNKEPARFANPRHMVLADVKGWFPFADIHLDEQTIQAVVDGAEQKLEPYLTDTDSVEFESFAHVIEATKT